MFDKLKSLLSFVKETIPTIENLLPAVEFVAGITPTPWDDKIVKGLKVVTEKVKQYLGTEGVKVASEIGINTAVLAAEMGLTLDEYTQATENGVKLYAAAKQLKRAARKRIKAGEMVALGNYKLRTIEDLQAVKQFEWDTAALIKLQMEKEQALLNAGPPEVNG
jgi:hypothetical protein